ncbi:MAG TPA: hypothetical protein VLL52_05970 [Anaerolineae bacterium]|nr:hypothetical protein [Anaerolineae bacterium]
MMTEQNEDKDRLIPLSEAAEIYGFTRVYLSELAKKGRLDAEKYGPIYMTTRAKMEEFIRSRQKRGAYRDDIQSN